jgi:hypothetical protein
MKFSAHDEVLAYDALVAVAAIETELVKKFSAHDEVLA